MDHGEIRQKLAAYLDNAVSQGEKEEIRAHLGRCGACRGEIADLELTVRMLKDLPEVEPPSWMADKIIAKIHYEPGHKKSLLQRIFFPLWPKLPIEAFALVLVCFVSYYLVKMSAEGPGSVKLPAAPRQAQEKRISKPEQEVTPPPPHVPLRGGGARRSPEPQVGTDSLKSEPALPAAPVEKEPAPKPVRPSARERVVPELQPFQDAFTPNNAAELAAKEGKSSRSMPLGPVAKERPVGNGEESSSLSVIRKEEVSLAVDDPDSASGKIEDAVIRFGGSVTGHSYSGETHLLFVKIRVDRLKPLMDRLGRIGTLKGRPQYRSDGDEMMELVIKW